MQILAHCNGDAACGQYIRVFEKAAAAEGKTLPADIRPVMIHAQLLGLDPVSYTHLDVYKRQWKRCWP